MPDPAPQKSKSPNNANQRDASLTMRINRAANELNPFLVVVAVGLLILNVTFYLGMSMSRQPLVSSAVHSYSAADDTSTAFHTGSTRY